MELTDAGRGFHEDARRLIADLDRARERARRTRRPRARRCGSPTRRASPHEALPLILDELATGAPGVVVSARQVWSTRAVEEVLLGEADVALVREFAGGEGLRTEVVRREPLAAFMSTRHPLAGRAPSRSATCAGTRSSSCPRPSPGFHSPSALSPGRGHRRGTASPCRDLRGPEHLFVGPVSMAARSATPADRTAGAGLVLVVPADDQQQRGRLRRPHSIQTGSASSHAP